MRTFAESLKHLGLKRIQPGGFGTPVQMSSPPPGDTAGELIASNEGPWRGIASWGYFSATFKPKYLEVTHAYLEELFGVTFAENSPAKFYRDGLIAAGGLAIDLDNFQDGSFRVQIPAEYLESIPPSRLKGVVDKFNEWGARCTRFDATLDVHGYRVPTPKAIADGLYEGKFYLVGFQHRNFRFILNGDQENEGNTLYLGKRKNSELYYRIYDRYGWTRLEPEFHGDKAKEAWYQFSCAVNGTGEYKSVAHCVAGIALGAVNFKTPTGKNTSQNPVADFWNRILNSIDAGTVKLQVKRKQVNASLERRLQWFRAQCAASAALIKFAFSQQNPGILDQIIEEAFLKLTEKDLALAVLPGGGSVYKE